MAPTKRIEISVEIIRQLFDYDPNTGEFKRRIDHGGGKAGAVITNMKVAIDGHNYIVARLIWLHFYGEPPPLDMFVDHKNRIKGINSIDNLRLATPTQNQLNKAGYGQYSKGVTWRDRYMNPWQAKIRVNGTRLHLGSFATEEEAAKAYQEACIKHHGEFACPK